MFLLEISVPSSIPINDSDLLALTLLLSSFPLCHHILGDKEGKHYSSCLHFPTTDLLHNPPIWILPPLVTQLSRWSTPHHNPFIQGPFLYPCPSCPRGSISLSCMLLTFETLLISLDSAFSGSPPIFLIFSFSASLVFFHLYLTILLPKTALFKNVLYRWKCSLYCPMQEPPAKCCP